MGNIPQVFSNKLLAFLRNSSEGDDPAIYTEVRKQEIKKGMLGALFIITSQYSTTFK